ncbi:hypothetical protein C8Q72DRAFT_886338 [Fomitopsis betulina]|nr:hypothetical protein C8Q72DRAFT_886338 [Fomitopsis betulina]
MAPRPQQPYQLRLTARYPDQSEETLAHLKSSQASRSDFTITPSPHSGFASDPPSVADFPLAKHHPEHPELAEGKAFWLILFALVISFFMAVLEGAALGNASPTIASDLDI